MRKTLVINSGSSSLKFKLYTMPGYIVDCEGIVDRIAIEGSSITVKYNGEKKVDKIQLENHEQAIEFLLKNLEKYNLIEDKSQITKVGHRVVQGGEIFTKSVLVTEENLKQMYELAKLAPLHNIANADGITIFQKLLPHAINVAVFDTEFHQTMPEESYLYPVDYTWYEKYGVRKYGAHGTSHKYIASKVCEITNSDLNTTNTINCHLGNGASITAIEGGKSIQTSMGLTPLAGVMMGTRSGDIDPSIIQYMNEQTSMSISEITNKLNTESGMIGLSKISSDFRDIGDAIEANNERAIMAMKVYNTRIIETIAAYAARLKKVDYITFTGGIGENDDIVRREVLNGLSIFGVVLDDKSNMNRSESTRIISKPESKITCYIIPTDEEFQICSDAENFEN